MIFSAQWHTGNITWMWRTIQFFIHSQQHITWIQKHFSPWSAVIFGRYSNFFCCLLPLLFSVPPMNTVSSWMSSSSVVLLDPTNWKHILIYKCEELEVYKWAHCLRKVTSEQWNTFNRTFTGHECSMSQMCVSVTLMCCYYWQTDWIKNNSGNSTS